MLGLNGVFWLTIWGGYGVEFKLVPNAQFSVLKNDLPKLRKAALSIGQGRKFFIDISRFEVPHRRPGPQQDR